MITNSKNSKNNDLLTIIRTNNIEVIKEYINENVVNIDEIKISENPLIFAIKNNISDSIIKFLISNIKQINFELNNGETPLTAALSHNKLKIAEDLINNGFNINYMNIYTENALIYLIKNNQISRESLSFLLNNNIDINIKDEDDRNALMYAVENELFLIVKDILEYYIMDNKFIINLLLLKQKRIKSSTKFLTKIIKHEFNKLHINDIDEEGNSAFLLACDNSDEETIKLLLKYGTNINLYDDFGYTPLLQSSCEGNVKRVQYLIKYGANINATDDYYNTSLTLACQNGHFEVVDILLKNGANVNVKNINGDTPINVACFALYVSSDNNYHKIIKLLLVYNADVNISNNDNSTPLTLASEIGEKKIVELLLEHGANVNIINDDGDSPLTLARKGHYNEIEELLIKYGAQIWINKKKIIIAIIFLYLYISYFIQNIILSKNHTKNVIKRY
ncbi:ankyrin [Piromyces finnis]|uniref:Ankyrin n=1 Tax=Piromyces finnis TaxID=1754191 RepID=A0A1Y1UY67_9FUNG|nr:ankyrin [Piromyces finnis]|eukprot:ORX43367.1 ankyrin [Piromyces finnis]